MAARKGIITFGLVSIPVELQPAARPLTIGANLLHAVCQSRIRQQWYCPTCERVVERSELIRGYPADGGHVTLSDQELEALEAASSRALDVQQFVDLAEVDPVYLETSFSVTPQKDTERAYEVLLAALQEAQRAAVVVFVQGGRQQHALLRPSEGVLVMHTLYAGDEVRPVEVTWKRPTPLPEEIRFAREFVEALTKPFDPAAFRDEYRDRLGALIQAKAEGQAVELPPAAPPPRPVINLMEALRQSVEQAKKPASKVEAAVSRSPRVARLDERKAAADRRRRGSG